LKTPHRSPIALPFPDSICHGCAHSRKIETKTSKFLLCAALATKYPRQPISQFPAFEPTAGPDLPRC
jgi:hypothetical protein